MAEQIELLKAEAVNEIASDLSALTAADRAATAADRTATSNDATTATNAAASAEASKDAATLIAATKGAYTDATIAAAIAAGVADLTVGDTFSATGDDVKYLGLYLIETGPVATEISRTLKSAEAQTKTNTAKAHAVTVGNDRLSDKQSPLFFNPYPLIRSNETGANFAEATIVSRDSDTQFTVASGQGNRFFARSAFVVKDDDTGKYLPFSCQSVSGDVVTILPSDTLPASITVCQQMHDGTSGQHLSRFGYLAYADYFYDEFVERYGYRKPTLFAHYNAALCNTASFNTYDILNYDKSETLFEVETVGGAFGGGNITGTTLARLCQSHPSDVNVSSMKTSNYTSRSYVVRDKNQGGGISIKFDALGYSGFVEIPFSSSRYYHAGDAFYTTGRGRLQVLVDGVSVHDEIYEQGKLHMAHVEFVEAQEIEIRATLADDEITQMDLYGFYAYAKSPDTPATSPLEHDVVLAVYTDSWGEFPNTLLPGEVLPTRADGSTASGMQFFSTRLQERADADGMRLTVHNMSRGSQTSEWGRYWAKEIPKLDPKPTHCFYGFVINDFNSNANAIAGTPSLYDFDTDDMWAQKYSNAGGVFGSVTYERWFENMQFISDYMLKNGIQPIVATPPLTASSAQSQVLQQQGLNRMAAGFNPLYANSARP